MFVLTISKISDKSLATKYKKLSHIDFYGNRSDFHGRDK